MQSAAWVQLLKLIPPNQQDNIVLVTTVEREISVQQFSQFADNYVVLRGRLGGTTDTDRIYVIPYDQLCYVGFIRPVKDELLERIFGALLPPPIPASAAPPPPEETAPAPTPTLAPDPELEAAPEPAMVQLPAKNPVAPTMPDKAELLRRIKQRSKTSSADINLDE